MFEHLSCENVHCNGVLCRIVAIIFATLTLLGKQVGNVGIVYKNFWMPSYCNNRSKAYCHDSVTGLPSIRMVAAELMS